MRLPDPSLAARRIGASLALVALVAACGPAAATPAPTPVVDPTPVIASPSPVAGGEAYWLRMTTWQAIPPVDQFAVGPTATVTGDGQYLLPGAVPAIFPGPLVYPYFGREVSEAGRDQILAWADELGLLSGETDFTGDLGMPGGVTGRVELTVDGSRVTLTGVPDAPGEPDPGSPAAFAELWRRVTSLSEMLGQELGPEQLWTPDGYAVLIGPPPDPQDGLGGQVAVWPLDVAPGEFGGPVMDGTYRCGLVEGEDAAVLRPAVESANQLTQWVQDPTTSMTFGLTVRPIVSGENPCAEVFGV